MADCRITETETIRSKGVKVGHIRGKVKLVYSYFSDKKENSSQEINQIKALKFIISKL